MADDVRVIIATAVTVAGAIAGFGLWALKTVVTAEVKPTLTELGLEAKALTREFSAFREEKAEDRRETTAILRDMQKLLQEHEVTLTQHDQRLMRLEAPPPAAAQRKRRAA